MPESRDITAEHARAAAEMEADVGAEHIPTFTRRALGRDRTRRPNGGGDRRVRHRDGRGDRPFPKLEAVFDSILVLPRKRWR